MKKIPFVPVNLPISNIDMNSISLNLSAADSKLGEFNAHLKLSKAGNPNALHQLLSMESLYSTRIEGTQTTLTEVFEAEEDKIQGRNTNEQSIIEVLHYKDAINLGSNMVKNGDPISSRLIKAIHKELLSGSKTRKNSRFIPGEYRTQQNIVGIHVPPIAANVEYHMSNLENYINAVPGYEDNLPILVKTAIIHAQFETIHPFPDGNGRVGRVLIPLYLYRNKKISNPYFFISKTLEERKYEYYRYLQETRSKSKDGFINWINFFLSAVERQAQNDIDFINSMNNLYEKTLEKTRRIINSNNIDKLVSAIFRNPVFSCKTISEEINVKVNTVRNYINKLEKAKIIYSNQSQRNKKYYFYSLIEILN